MKNIFCISILLVLFLTGCSNKNESISSENSSNTAMKQNTTGSNDFIQETALHDAIRAKDLRLIKELLSKDVAFDTQDDYGYTPLHLAVRVGLYDVSELLIKKGANVNNRDNFEDTILIDSTRNSTNKLSRLLLCNGANPEVIDQHDMTPLNNASKNNDLYIAKMIQSNERSSMCQPLKISLDEYNAALNTICGSIKEGIADSVNLVITDEESETLEPFGQYKGNIKGNKYCANLNKKLNASKSYLITATGVNEIEKDVAVSNVKDITAAPAVAKDMKKVEKITGLYEDLQEEFASDFDHWNAQLDKDGLIFRFQKPEVLFSLNSSDIQTSFQAILSDFFPRYLKVINQYKDEIQSVVVQGHTSSEYSSAKNDEERYAKNKVLSEKRAQQVYAFTSNLSNSEWLVAHYSFAGKAYDNLILDDNGVEDSNLSRRVEFRINTISK